MTEENVIDVGYMEGVRQPGIQSGNVVLNVSKIWVSCEIRTPTGKFSGGMTLDGDEVSLPVAIPVEEGAEELEDVVSMSVLSDIMLKMHITNKNTLLEASKPEEDF